MELLSIMKIFRKWAHSKASSLSRSPAAVVLHDELITEILSWLPVKALVRMRCICKSWKTLISDPNFIKLHLHRSARNMHLNFPDFTSAPFSLREPCTLLEYKNQDGYWIVGSCNGLFCLRIVDSFTTAFEEYWLLLWNPAARLNSEKFVFLNYPKPERFDTAKRKVFDTFRFAFGYDSITDTYKVVAFCLDEEASQVVKVFSIGDNCWRDIQSFPALPIRFINHYPGKNDGVYLSDTLNWLALRDVSQEHCWGFDLDDIAVDKLVIVSLNLVSETFTQMLLPHVFDEEEPAIEPIVTVLMECLCISHQIYSEYLVIWQMKEFGVEKSWIQILKFSLEYLPLDIRFRCFWLPLQLSKNGDVLTMGKEDRNEDTVIHCNLRDNSVEITRLTNPYRIHLDVTRYYVESFVWPC